MTKEITKARILQEIQDKFNLRELIPEKFTFSENVVPTYDVEPHLQSWFTTKKIISVNAAAAFLLFTVPQTQRWFIRSYQIVPMGAGAYTWAGLYILRGSGHFIYLDLKAAQAVATLTTPATLIPLFENDKLYVNVDGFTSTQNMEITIDYMKEETR